MFSIKIWQLWQAIAKYTKRMCYTRNMYWFRTKCKYTNECFSSLPRSRVRQQRPLFSASLYCPTTFFLLLSLVLSSVFPVSPAPRSQRGAGVLIAPEPDSALPSSALHTCMYMRVAPRKYQCCLHRLGAPAFSVLALACFVYKTTVWARKLLAYSFYRWGWGEFLHLHLTS